METLIILQKIMPSGLAIAAIIIILIVCRMRIRYRKARQETLITQLKEHLEENEGCLNNCLEAANRAFPEEFQPESPPIGNKEDWSLGDKVNSMAIICRQNLSAINGYMETIKRNFRIAIPEKYGKMMSSQLAKQSKIEQKLKAAGYSWMA